MAKEEREKGVIHKELQALTDKYHKLNDSIAKKAEAINEYDRTIQETEAAYLKVKHSVHHDYTLFLLSCRSWRARRLFCTY
jgi:hypothetical protein